MLPSVICEGFDDSVILAPGAVMTGNHEMYKVFTPFKNARLKRLKKISAVRSGPESGKRRAFTLNASLGNYPQQAFDAALSSGRKRGHRAATSVLRAGRRRVCVTARFPAVDGTSRLSASGDRWPVAATVPAPITGGAAAGAGRQIRKRLVE